MCAQLNDNCFDGSKSAGAMKAGKASALLRNMVQAWEAASHARDTTVLVRDWRLDDFSCTIVRDEVLFAQPACMNSEQQEEKAVAAGPVGPHIEK